MQSKKKILEEHSIRDRQELDSSRKGLFPSKIFLGDRAGVSMSCDRPYLRDRRARLGVVYIPMERDC